MRLPNRLFGCLCACLLIDFCIYSRYVLQNSDRDFILLHLAGKEGGNGEIGRMHIWSLRTSYSSRLTIFYNKNSNNPYYCKWLLSVCTSITQNLLRAVMLDFTFCTYFLILPGWVIFKEIPQSPCKLNRVGPIQKYMLQRILRYICISSGTELYLISPACLYMFRCFSKGLSYQFST